MTKEIGFPGDAATEEWLAAQKPHTRTTYACAWRHFLALAGMTGDQILASRKSDRDFLWEKKTLASKQAMKDKGMADNGAKGVTTAARSFFAYHRLPLQFRKTEKARLTEAHAKTEDYRFSLEDLKKMYDVADLKERYVLAAGKSFGLRAGDFMKMERGDLGPYIDREVPISIGKYDTEKEGVYAYPFIDSDAQPVVKLMLEEMTRKGRASQNEKMLEYSDDIQLSRVLKRLVEKAGIGVGNKTVRFHCMRKFLIDHLSSYMSESKWKQVVGKHISEGAYVSPDSLRSDYMRVMNETCFDKSIDDKAKQAAKEEFDKLFTPEQKEFLRSHGGVRFAKLKGRTKKCGDEEHCQKVASEEELPGLLRRGWRASVVLPSGKVVVEK